MMKNKSNMLSDLTDIKVFILCLLDEMNHPATYTGILNAISDTECVGGFDFTDAFSRLAEDGHVIGDSLDGEMYYIISETGSRVARELRDTLPPPVREKLHVTAIRHLALARMGVVLTVHIEEENDGRYRVSFYIQDGVRGNMMEMSVSVPDKDTANRIKTHCESVKAEDIYRSVMAVITGEFAYFA